MTLLEAVQITVILQGVFLLLVLFNKRESYKKTTFWLFLGCLISVSLFAIGDDSYNLIVDNANWFLFQEPLMITFFFLFVRYRNSKEPRFRKRDALFFLPYFLFVSVETIMNIDYFASNAILRTLEEIIEFSFLGMLFYSIYDIIIDRKEKWLIAFIAPLTLMFMIDEIYSMTIGSQASFFFLDSYGIILIGAFLFYFVSYRLIVAPKDILASTNHNKYKSSSLSMLEIESTTKELHLLMTEKKIFKNQKLNVTEVAIQLGITRQELSEILNVHMEVRFQDLISKFRVEEFIECLHQETYKNYTLLGIATEVGFSSKSSFNSIFKKLKGVTPSEYKKSENLV